MSDESENYITPIFSVDDEVEEVNEVQQGGASITTGDFLRKNSAKLLAMFQTGLSTTFSTMLPPILDILKYEKDGKTIMQVKTIDDLKTNKLPQNFPVLVLYQFLQKAAPLMNQYQLVKTGLEVKDKDGKVLTVDEIMNQVLPLIEISVRLYILTYFLASKNDFTGDTKEKIDTTVADKYFGKKSAVPTYNEYFTELNSSLLAFESGFFNFPGDKSDLVHLDILSNILTHYGVSYFKLGTTNYKFDTPEIVSTEDTYYFKKMKDMLDFLIKNVPEPVAAPASTSAASTTPPPPPPPGAANILARLKEAEIAAQAAFNDADAAVKAAEAEATKTKEAQTAADAALATLKGEIDALPEEERPARQGELDAATKAASDAKTAAEAADAALTAAKADLATKDEALKSAKTKVAEQEAAGAALIGGAKTYKHRRAHRRNTSRKSRKE